jgi:heme A synthase
MEIDVWQGVFGMNVIELNSGTYGTIPHYVAATLSLTALVIWIIVAYQSQFVLRDDQPMWKKLLWPFAFVSKLISRPQRRGGHSTTLPI